VSCSGSAACCHGDAPRQPARWRQPARRPHLARSPRHRAPLAERALLARRPAAEGARSQHDAVCIELRDGGAAITPAPAKNTHTRALTRTNARSRAVRRYYGDASAEQQARQASYQAPGGAPKWGWGATECSQALPAICVLAAAGFPCQPPPSPRPPPPPPPAPPLPPAPLTSERRPPAPAPLQAAPLPTLPAPAAAAAAWHQLPVALPTGPLLQALRCHQRPRWPYSQPLCPSTSPPQAPPRPTAPLCASPPAPAATCW
jgi:hypothetical protein